MMKHCIVTKAYETKLFKEICQRYYCGIKIRRCDKNHDVVIVESSMLTWFKIRFWFWIETDTLEIEIAE